MSGSIRLSPKHGVNPSLLLCWWCFEPSAVALCGALRPKNDNLDPEAPREMLDSPANPCPKCKKLIDDNGAVFIYESDVPDSTLGTVLTPEHRTGRFFALTPEGARAMFTPEAAEAIIRSHRGMMSKEAFAAITARFPALQSKDAEGAESTGEEDDDDAGCSCGENCDRSPGDPCPKE